jgi:hypothetical protein
MPSTMHSLHKALTIGAVAVIAVACGCANDPAPCDGRAMRDRIAMLASGERLELGASCVVEGALVVPAGAIVHGGTFALSEGDAITLTPSPTGAPVTTLSEAHVIGGSDTAVALRGPGHARIEATSFELTRGIAIGVAESEVEVVDVHVTGNVDPANVLAVPSSAEGFARYGLVAVEGATVHVTGSRFARLAVSALGCDDATLTLEGVTLEENLGVGLAAFACMVSASDVEVMHTLSGPGLIGIGFALLDASVLETGDSLHFHDAPGFAIYASASDVTLTSPIVERMGQVGVWAEMGGTLHVADGTFTDVEGIAIGSVGATEVDVRGTMVTGTRDALLPRMGGASGERVADAIHVVQTSARDTIVSITDTTLVDNGRVGLVLDGGGAALALTLTGTRAEGTGDELGAIAQNVAALPIDWDSGVTRVGSAASLDGTAGTLVVSNGTDAAGVLMPPTISF